MQEHKYNIIVAKKAKLLEIVVEGYCDKASLYIEGDLSQLQVAKLGVSKEVGRITIYPKQQSVTIFISEATKPLISKYIIAMAGVSTRIFHIEIIQEGSVVFASYDTFAEGCVSITADVEANFLQELVSAGVIKSYSLV